MNFAHLVHVDRTIGFPDGFPFVVQQNVVFQTEISFFKGGTLEDTSFPRFQQIPLRNGRRLKHVTRVVGQKFVTSLLYGIHGFT